MVDRWRLLDAAHRALELAGADGKNLEPASSGKKGLVFLADSVVVRLYTNPLYYLRRRLVDARLLRLGIPLSPEVVATGCFFFKRPLWFVVEERLQQPGALSPDQKLDFVKRLGLLHAETSVKVGAGFIWRKWAKKTDANAKFLLNNTTLEFSKTLAGMWTDLRARGVTPSSVSLCHRDVGLSNMGLKGERLLLIDWDRASLFFPLYELIQACYFLDLDPVDALCACGIPVCRNELALMLVSFCISRAKKEYKRGSVSERLGRFVKWAERIFSEGYQR